MICHPFIAFEGVTFACTWLLTWTFPPKEKKTEQLKLRSHHCQSAKASPVPAGWLAIRQHFALYRDHYCLRCLKSEAWPPKSRDITWTSSSGESWRGWYAVKIQGIDSLKERLRLCLAHISQHRMDKAIQAFTKRLKGCIARHGGRFELKPKWDEKMMEALVGRGCFAYILQIKWRLCCDKGMTKQSVRRNPSEIWTRKNLTTFGLQPVTTLFERETECEYIYSTGNCPLFQMPYLAKSYDSSVVSYLTWKLGVTYFLNHPV